MLSAHFSAISGNKKLFARIAAVWEQREVLDLTDEQAARDPAGHSEAARRNRGSARSPSCA